MNISNGLPAPDLPPGSIVKDPTPHGAVYWTRAAVIQTQQQDESILKFFLKVRCGFVQKCSELIIGQFKVTHTDVGKANLHGEFASISAIHKAVPDLVPAPIAVGTYASDPDV